MIINHNISALLTNMHLQGSQKKADTSLERLSSGYRINKAADDAAGMAISQKMKTQIAGLKQASRNASDGISVIQTAEGALSETENMLQRARELCVQAANDTNTPSDRAAIQEEVDKLMEEINRISTDTEFNTKSLLNGNLDRLTYTNNTKVNIVYASEEVAAKDYYIQVASVGTAANLAATSTVAAYQGTLQAALGASYDPDREYSITLNGETLNLTGNESNTEILRGLQDMADRTNLDMTVNGSAVNFTSKETGLSKSIQLSFSDNTLAGLFGYNTPTPATVHGTDAKVNVNTTGHTTDFATPVTVLANGNNVSIKCSNGFEMQVDIDKTTAAGASVKLTVIDAGPMVLQIGANEGQTMSVTIPEVSQKTLGLENLNACTRKGASEGIALLDAAVNTVSNVRSKLGAYQNRLDHAISSLDTSDLNLTEALSRIEDVDMAEEMALYTQYNVLTQAGVSMLSQANERPQQVLSLLQ